MSIDRNLARLRLDLDAHPIKIEPLCIRSAADGHEHLVAGDRERLAVLRFSRHGHSPTLDPGAGDLGLQVEFQALFGQALLEEVTDLDIGHRHDAGQELDDRDFRSQPLPDRAQLQTDVAAAYHHQVTGNLLEGQGIGRVDDHLAVEWEKRQRRGFGSRGQQDVAGLELDGRPFRYHDLRGRA
jgi:hypothetical protein